MFLTNVLLKKVKSKNVLVVLESLATGHKRIQIRERAGDKIEAVFFDPFVQTSVLYREIKKLRGV